MLLGFTDRCFEGWVDGCQATEENQRRRLHELLSQALPDDERERLIQQGRALSLFEADRLAGFSRPERSRQRL